MARAETVLMLGESGAGKSTLLSLICGTLEAKAGQITVADQDMTQLSAAARDKHRADQIGVIFQQFNLLPFGTVLDNILVPLSFSKTRRDRVSDPRGEALRLCQALNLPTDLLGAKAATLSVGQQQRVAVARALIGQPALIIADEPTSALDADTQGAFLDLLFAQVAKNKTSLLMVSHDPRLADRFDRVVQLSDIAKTTLEAA
jgi:putative ABC transport system ATP-binding protein